jgi:hypothetical protein
MLLLLSAATISGLTQDSSYLDGPPLFIKRLSGPIELDGLSDEPAWLDALAVPFIVYRPVWGQMPTERTELRVGHDDDFLYVAGRCYTQDPATIVARNLVRDGWRGDDWMTFHIDSRFDKQNALVFSIYPLGSRYDAAVSNDAVDLGNFTFNPDFNMIWDARSVITDEGWFYEMKIPLYNLRVKADETGTIQVGISASRIIQHNQEYHQFPAIPQNVIDPISKPSFKQPAIIQGIPPPRLFLLTPYTLLSRSRRHQPAQPPSAFERKVGYDRQLGLDAKIGLSPYLTLDVSLNPDFAQVEADDQLVNLTRFSLFFPEKRLFFQEAAGLFDLSLGGNSQLFYSRRIGINAGQLTSIYGGVRVTGKLGKNTDIGLLNMQSAPTALDGGEQLAAENFGVLRLRTKVLNDRSFIGFMATNRNGAQRQNYALGLDALLNPSGIHYFLLSAASTLDRREGTSLESGIDASRWSLLWETRKTDELHHRLGYTFSGKRFNPQVGFVDRSGFHNFWGNLSHGRFASAQAGRFQYRRFTFLQYNAFLNASSTRWETIELGSQAQLRTFKGTEWNGGANYHYEFLEEALDFGNGISIRPGAYHFATARLNFFPPRYRNIRTAVRIAEGGFFDGRRFNLNVNPILNFGKHWEVQAAYDFSYLRFREQRLYRPIHVARLQLNFALNLHFSANLIAQYNSSVNQVFHNFRLRYNFKDGHDLFLVWNENFFVDRRLGDDLLRPLSGEQAFILKYNYTFDRILKR